MKSPVRRPASSHSRFFDGCYTTFGIAPTVPRVGRAMIIAIAFGAVLMTGAAAAAWQVNDRNSQTELKEIKNRIGNNGTVTGKVNDLNLKLQVDVRSNEQLPAMIQAPTGVEALDAQQPTSTPVAIGKLCNPGVSSALGQQQLQLCQAQAQTELAKYRFSMRMAKRADENYTRLKQIQDRRRNLGVNDYADVQYNTNELLTLTALMDNDRDRYMTYMQAYDSRVMHIANARSALTRNALKGSGSFSLTSLASSF